LGYLYFWKHPYLYFRSGMEWNAFQRAKLATFAIFQLLHGSVKKKGIPSIAAFL